VFEPALAALMRRSHEAHADEARLEDACEFSIRAHPGKANEPKAGAARQTTGGG
jgi:hypothetical protein